MLVVRLFHHLCKILGLNARWVSIVPTDKYSRLNLGAAPGVWPISWVFEIASGRWAYTRVSSTTGVSGALPCTSSPRDLYQLATLTFCTIKQYSGPLTTPVLNIIPLRV